MKYFVNGAEIHFFGNRSGAEKIVDFFSNGKKHIGEAPDMAIVLNGNCLAVEHFEFDCYRNDKSGSKNKKEMARIERAYSSLPISNMDVSLHDKINGESSYEQYVQNIKKTFKKHYSKIDEYKNNLHNLSFINVNTPIKTAFLIEDTSPLGTAAYDINGKYDIVLSRSKEFLQLMRVSSELDYVIACSYDGNKNIIWLIEQEKIDEYESNIIDYANMDFMNYVPQVLSFRIKIPKEN